MQEIKDGVLTKTPAEIFDQTTDGNRLTDIVRNKRQIINAKSRVQQQPGAGCDVVRIKRAADVRPGCKTQRIAPTLRQDGSHSRPRVRSLKETRIFQNMCFWTRKLLPPVWAYAKR
ncbi:hypothetical protein PoB_003196100 [Plakobranchus ocellatus]|uniref:Uncharacterized protein n=1 Tax=Plakobranchus ocellatus TaxID=259542 RepID=A0AAV4A2K0_9GAST|nr:hypothetical protein PoB_003196100 [Plakobranchus ocellatus]